MTKEDKQIIDRAIKEEWRIGDRTRLKRLLEKNLKLYRENVELEKENEEIKKGLGCETCQIHLEYMGLNDKINKLEKEYKLLGERCNQLLKDKGNLTDELQELKETLAQTVENNEVAYETLKLHDQEEIGMLNSKVTELENKIADIKANCDLAIEGRDIKIKELELELTVEKDQHQEEIELHLHAEDYIKSLEQQIEKMKRHCNCKHRDSEGYCEVKRTYLMDLSYDGCDKWELEETRR